MTQHTQPRDERGAIALVVFDVPGLQILLTPRSEEPDAGRWSLFGERGGQAEPEEEDALCILKAQTGCIPVLHIERLGLFYATGSDQQPSPTLSAYLIYAAEGQQAGRRAALQGEWWSVRDLPPLASEHVPIVRYAIKQLALQLALTEQALKVLPDHLTLADVREILRGLRSTDPR